MNVEETIRKFDQIIDSMSDDDLVAAFTELGYEFEPAASPNSYVFSHLLEMDFENKNMEQRKPAKLESNDAYSCAADSNELALAA